jgi:N6-L-threonylcarbamoyladenine synthase
MYILAIDTSFDETAAAVVSGRRVISNVIYSQVLHHTQWGGVVPSIAKRAHEERIDMIVEKAMKRARIQKPGAIAVTQGPGLAIALEVGIRKAKELAAQFSVPLIAVNHMEGHLYSSFVQNSAGRPERAFEFPYLGLLVSGAHTEIVLFRNHLDYEVIGETLDDAAGEAYDKGARMLGFGYPGGAVIERLAQEVNNEDRYKFPRPMQRADTLNFSFSGLKTALLYTLKKMTEEEKIDQMKYLASSYQEAIIDSLLMKLKKAIAQTGVNRVVCGGGVVVNTRLRNQLRALMKTNGGSVAFPSYKYLNFDNAAMIGVAASFKAEKKLYVRDSSMLDRVPRLRLG